MAGFVARRGGKPWNEFMAIFMAGGWCDQQCAQFVAVLLARCSRRGIEFLAGFVAWRGPERVLEFLVEFLGCQRGGIRDTAKLVAEFLADGSQRRVVLEFLAQFVEWSGGCFLDHLFLYEFLALLVAGCGGDGIEFLEFVAEFLG